MSLAKPAKRVRLDAKGRITLGKYVPEGITGFEVTVQKNGCLLLSPIVEVPARETWFYKNKAAMAMVEKGLADAKAGRLVKGPLDDGDMSWVDELED